MPTKTYGDDTNSNGKVLVAYATRAGSTIEVADSIALNISRNEYVVDLMHVGRVESISDYKFVIVGSAIRMRKVTPEAKKFVENFKNDLSNTPPPFLSPASHLKMILQKTVKRLRLI
jgi:menaquinone-dependent protoporphyrinogen oxidase